MVKPLKKCIRHGAELSKAGTAKNSEPKMPNKRDVVEAYAGALAIKSSLLKAGACYA